MGCVCLCQAAECLATGLPPPSPWHLLGRRRNASCIATSTLRCLLPSSPAALPVERLRRTPSSEGCTATWLPRTERCNAPPPPRGGAAFLGTGKHLSRWFEAYVNEAEVRRERGA